MQNSPRHSVSSWRGTSGTTATVQRNSSRRLALLSPNFEQSVAILLGVLLLALVALGIGSILLAARLFG
jgi:hypothetical protein